MLSVDFLELPLVNVEKDANEVSTSIATLLRLLFSVYVNEITIIVYRNVEL